MADDSKRPLTLHMVLETKDPPKLIGFDVLDHTGKVLGIVTLAEVLRAMGAAEPLPPGTPPTV